MGELYISVTYLAYNPYNESHSTSGSLLGPLIFGSSTVASVRHAAVVCPGACLESSGWLSKLWSLWGSLV